MLNEAEILTASNAIREFRVALSNLFLYTSDNAMVAQSLNRFLEALVKILVSRDEVTLGLSEGRLLIEGAPLNERLTGSTNMIRDLFQTHEIHSITFTRGLTASELRSFAQKLKPRALPAGTTLTQALKAESLDHLEVNQKMFVAVKEGETIGGSGTGIEEAGFNEALEALQYFLQVFSRVKPDSNKKEIARKLTENIGEWIPDLSASPVIGGSGGGSGSPETSLGRLLAVFQELQTLLANVPVPPDMKTDRLDLDGLVQKMTAALLLQAEKESKAEGAQDDISQTTFFENDPVLTALESGFHAPLQNPHQEEVVARCIQALQKQGKMDSMDSLWEGLWKVLDNTDESIQSLGLRHLNRWNWETLPRHLQLDGLQRLSAFLDRPPAATPCQSALLLARGWLEKEWKNPDWPVFNELVACVHALSGKSATATAAQAAFAQKALEGLFPKKALDELWNRFQKGGFDSHGPSELWVVLGSFAMPYLMPKALEESAPEESRSRVFETLERMEFSGNPVLEQWISSKPRSGWGPFLTIFHRITLTAGVAKKLVEAWPQMNSAERLSALRGAARWNRREFRESAFAIIQDGPHTEALELLQLLPNISHEGDSRVVLEAVDKRKYRDKHEREEFQIEACRTLGRIGDSLAIHPLQEWTETQGVLGKLLEKSHAVRSAALMALGQFRSQQVRAFLEKYAEHGSKDLRSTALEALKVSSANLSGSA